MTDRLTDHATRSVAIGGAHSAEAKFFIFLRLQGVSLTSPESSTQTASRLLKPFLPGSLGDKLTDRPTDHANWSVTIGGAHSGVTKFCYYLRPQQVFIGAVDSTDRINFRNKQLYSAVRLDGCSVSENILQYSLEESVSHQRP